MPSLSSSPRTRSAPHRGLRPAISRMSAARFVGGRPDRRERRRQNARNPARCQRRTVAGWMSRVASRQAGATRAARTIVKRCQGFHRTRPASFRSAAMSCCRRSAFSATSSTRRRTRSTASLNTNRRRSITCRVLHRLRADGICSQDGPRSCTPDLVTGPIVLDSAAVTSRAHDQDLPSIGGAHRGIRCSTTSDRVLANDRRLPANKTPSQTRSREWS